MHTTQSGRLLLCISSVRLRSEHKASSVPLFRRNAFWNSCMRARWSIVSTYEPKEEEEEEEGEEEEKALGEGEEEEEEEEEDDDDDDDDDDDMIDPMEMLDRLNAIDRNDEE
eukprot:312686-Pyramimonas_sp.AAC.1